MLFIIKKNSILHFFCPLFPTFPSHPIVRPYFKIYIIHSYISYEMYMAWGISKLKINYSNLSYPRGILCTRLEVFGNRDHWHQGICSFLSMLSGTIVRFWMFFWIPCKTMRVLHITINKTKKLVYVMGVNYKMYHRLTIYYLPYYQI